MITTGIIEDLEDYRNLLQVLFEHSQDMQVLFCAKNAEEAMTGISSNKPGLCIIDINLPGQSGIELVKWIRSNSPATLCLMCTAYDSDDKIFQSLEAGAHGYILKSEAPARILEAVTELCLGGSPMSSQVARKVVQSFRKTPASTAIPLTKREEEILTQLSKGLLYKEIATSLYISTETVRRHCFNIYEKLHVHNRTEALNKYFGK
ncbi:MAG: response regulator transcription factor [Chitinophagaceae bacterium]|nr:response regulator transcription factor [Chitinophagaceae bacterium]